jgi:DHA1 family bicyclomycin/chloramphenicol resistance-like MFS transporter
MNAPPPAAAPSTWRVANVVAQIGYGLLAMTICLPSMPEWSTGFGTTPAAVQLTFSAYVLTYGGLQLVHGPLSDRQGRRRVLMWGLVIAGIGSVLAALAGSIDALIGARALQGAGAAAGMVAGRAIVQDLFAGPQRTRVMAYVGMAMGLIPPTATIVGGQMHVRLGWQAAFVLMATLAVLLLLAAWRGLPDDHPRQGPRTGAPVGGGVRELGNAYAALLRHRAFVLHVAVLAFTVAAFYAFLSGAPLVLANLGVGPAQVGFYIMAVPLSYIAGNYACSRLVHGRGEAWLMRTGQACTVLGIVLMLALGLAGVREPLAFALPLIALGIGHGLLMPPTLARTVGVVAALAGSAAAIAGVMQQFVGALGAYAVGWVTHESQVNLALVMLCFTLLAQAALAALARR